MTTGREIIDFLEGFAPTRSAESWDNVGLLLGDSAQSVTRVMTCLTLTPDVAQEAVTAGAEFIVTHHPILFRPVQSLTTANPQGAMLLGLAQAGVAVFSPHTAFDSAVNGVNQQLAELFELQDIAPIRPADEENGPGSGRHGVLSTETTLGDFVRVVAEQLSAPHLSYVGDDRQRVQRVGVACGAAAEFMSDARKLGCDVLVTGEARFHDCLEARGTGIGLVLVGHYQSERPAVESLAATLSENFPALEVWASRTESDPLSWI
ncbi:MAG: Nif3-like dinuclear metal center hexameric protein [Planctomycetaceae bacterium]|nr:Nif3-like dinuclear metal center hexameric protein [Planctomycetaceae bacterium]MCB9953531.1 Nif3-like dinuclear metal center hexameric protein [Planctomycetaceae bacterium]